MIVNLFVYKFSFIIKIQNNSPQMSRILPKFILKFLLP
jgi:hypothetical protein